MSRLLVMPRRDRSRTSLEASPLRLQGARLLLVTGTGRQRQAHRREPARRRPRLRPHRPRQPACEPALPRSRHRGPARGARGEPRARAGHRRHLDAEASQRNGALPFVRLMQSYGFDWVWLDGDRGAAFHGYFSARNGEAARFVDPFEPDGRFRPMPALLDEVLEPGPVAQPLPARRRMPRELVAFGRRHLRRAGKPGLAARSPGREPRTRGPGRRSRLRDGRRRRRRVRAHRRHRRSQRLARAAVGAGQAGHAAGGGHPRQRREPRRRAARRHHRGRAQAVGPPLHRLRGLRADDVVLLVPVERRRARAWSSATATSPASTRSARRPAGAARTGSRSAAT